VNALRDRNRVFRQNRRQTDHLWHFWNALSVQQADVRPRGQTAVEFIARKPLIGFLAHREDLKLEISPRGSHDMGSSGWPNTRIPRSFHRSMTSIVRLSIRGRTTTNRPITDIGQSRTRCSLCGIGIATWGPRQGFLASVSVIAT